ncbi:hypothetical protein LCGC14_2488980 [marine sediment metagenome]|uniref:Tyr recombinase domain-containing protein n=1 Tax=marine sediment metagenome TaxID=412755 RepID=A0A0F9BT91_9ZZZZ
MPIINYELKAKQSEENFFKNKDISEENIKEIKKFLIQYNVKAATKNIFFKHIVFLLKKTDNIKKDMQDRELINKIFQQIRGSVGKGYLFTIIKVSKMFCRWLNDGELPKGFKDIKSISKKEQKRDLKPEDMVTWKDGLNLSKATTSIQIKAVILSQLDGGFRPSEFIDLNYGDITIKKEFIIARVNGGKTGSRNVILYKSVPYLMRWIKDHPSQKKDDPLWVMEFNEKSHTKIKKSYKIRRYEYSALAKRVIQLGEKINIGKPLDFYNLRHSACSLAKLDNLPLEECSKKFGHSVDFFVGTYGRLSVEDSIKRMSKSYGIEKEKIKREVTISCRCGFVNKPNSEFCEQCNNPLTLGKALELEKGKDEKINKLEEDMTELKKAIQLIVDVKGDIGKLEKAEKIAEAKAK